MFGPGFTQQKSTFTASVLEGEYTGQSNNSQAHSISGEKRIYFSLPLCPEWVQTSLVAVVVYNQATKIIYEKDESLSGEMKTWPVFAFCGSDASVWMIWCSDQI